MEILRHWSISGAGSFLIGVVFRVRNIACHFSGSCSLAELAAEPSQQFLVFGFKALHDRGDPASVGWKDASDQPPPCIYFAFIMEAQPFAFFLSSLPWAHRWTLDCRNSALKVFFQRMKPLAL